MTYNITRLHIVTAPSQLIADEVICGFGRTGKMFGTETFGLKPDIMTMAKALSSAYLPISVIELMRRSAVGRSAV